MQYKRERKNRIKVLEKKKKKEQKREKRQKLKKIKKRKEKGPVWICCLKMSVFKNSVSKMCIWKTQF